MWKSLAPLVAFTLSWGLSCSVWNSPPPAAPGTGARSPPRRAESRAPLAPGRVEMVGARFLRRQSGLAPFEVRRVAETILEESARWSLDPGLILAVIQTESAFHNFAVSHAGAMGLMQIMPATGARLAADMGLPWRPDLLFDPVINVRMGTRYLAALRARYGKLGPALAAYNWGPRRIDRRLHAGRALPAGYAHRVLLQWEAGSGG